MVATPVITQLEDLYDVPAIADGQTIVRDGASLVAKNFALAALDDTEITTPSVGDVPMFDGTKFVNSQGAFFGSLDGGSPSSVFPADPSIDGGTP